MTIWPRTRGAVLLACWVVMQVIPPLCLTADYLCRNRRAQFDDPASRTVRASLILGARAQRILRFDAGNWTQGVVFTVERVLKGVYPVIGTRGSSTIVVLFSEEELRNPGRLPFEECLRSVVRSGSRYVVFVDDGQVRGHVLRDRWLTTAVKASGLPRIATESLVRIVKNYSCSRCGLYMHLCIRLCM